MSCVVLLSSSCPDWPTAPQGKGSLSQDLPSLLDVDGPLPRLHAELTPARFADPPMRISLSCLSCIGSSSCCTPPRRISGLCSRLLWFARQNPTTLLRAPLAFSHPLPRSLVVVGSSSGAAALRLQNTWRGQAKSSTLDAKNEPMEGDEVEASTRYLRGPC